MNWGGTLPEYHGNPAGHATSLANRVGGIDLALRRVEIDETRDIARYGRQLKELGDEPSIAILNEVIADKQYTTRSPSTICARLTTPLPPAGTAQGALDDLLAARDTGACCSMVGRRDLRNQRPSDYIFGIRSGVSGATLGNAHFVLIAGLAGMIASALSMGSGAYLAAKSEREIYEAEFARERAASRTTNPTALRRELSRRPATQIRGRPQSYMPTSAKVLPQDSLTLA